MESVGMYVGTVMYADPSASNTFKTADTTWEASWVFTLILAALVLQEAFTPKSIIGCVLIGAGTLLMVL